MPAGDSYPLTIRGFNGSDDTDWFLPHQLNKMKFSNPDENNDLANGNCPAHWKTVWWYNNCTDIKINTKPPHNFIDNLALCS